MTSIVVESAALASALKAVTSIVNKAETVPIMSMILIETIGTEHIRITATDHSKRIERTMAAQVEEGGSFAVEAAKLTAIMGAAPEGSMAKLETAENGVAVRYARSRFRFATLPADQYPPAIARETVTSITAGTPLLEALALSRPTHGTMETQVFTLGALLTDRNGLEVVTVGDSGHRCSIVSIGGAGVPQSIVPTDAVDLILRLAAGEFQVDVQQGAIRCDFGMTVLTAQLLDVQYPDYMRIVPKGDMQRNAILGSAELAGALTRLSLMANDRDRKVRLSFSENKLVLTLDTNVDQASEEIACAYEGEPLAISFKAQYLRDALSALNVDDVVIGLNGDRDPARITSKERPQATLIIAPMF